MNMQRQCIEEVQFEKIARYLTTARTMSDSTEFPTISEIRRENARKLAAEVGSNAKFAETIGREPTQVSRFIGKNPTVAIGDDLARHIEEQHRLPRGFLDQNWKGTAGVRENMAPYRAQKIKTIPLHTEQTLISGGEPLETSLTCPMPHSDKTFTYKVSGPTMTASSGPSFSHGSYIYVDPEQAITAESGDLVLAYIPSRKAIGFRMLIEEAGQTYLRPLNIQFPISTDEFEIIGKVIGAWIPTTNSVEPV